MDDETAIRACHAGEADAFRFLVERYQREALAHASALLRDREEALDAVQDAFLRAFRSLHGFESNRRFYPWLYAILRNVCYKILGARRRRPGTVDSGASEILDRPATDPGTAGELERALAELDPEDRELITLKHLDGMGYLELSERMGIPAGTVMSRLFHARRRLRERLGRPLAAEEKA